MPAFACVHVRGVGEALQTDNTCMPDVTISQRRLSGQQQQQQQRITQQQRCDVDLKCKPLDALSRL